MPEDRDTITSDPEASSEASGEQDSRELEAAILGGGEGAESDSETEGKKFLDRFDTQEEAKEYLESLEAKVKAAEDKAGEANIRSLRKANVPRETPPEEPEPAKKEGKPGKSRLHEVLDQASADIVEEAIQTRIRAEIDPILQKQREAQDNQDSKIIIKMPNYERYVSEAKEFMARNPNASILEAFKAVASPKDIAHLDREETDIKNREILKKSARGERSGDAGSTADPNSTRTLEKTLFGADSEHRAERNFFGVV